MAKIRKAASASRRSPRVAVLVETSTGWGRDIIRGVHSYSQKHGPWQLFVEPRGADELLELPRGWSGDGVIARVNRPELARQLKSRRIPVINVSAMHLPHAPFRRVASDVAASADLAATYFLERGFKNFAYVSLHGPQYVSQQRDAFLKALKWAGHGCVDFDLKVHGIGHAPDWNLRIDRLAHWLKALPKPVAIFTWSGGREIIHACAYAGLAVPEQVALLSGSNDDLFCEVSPIPISAVRQSCQEIGNQAASLLQRLMRGGTVSMKPHWIAPLSVVTRQSTDTLALNDSALVAALKYIRENADKLIQVRDVCVSAGLSRRVLERRFAELLGRSPASHIRRVHLDRAKKLLAETNLPVPEVASRSGFGSPEYLAYALARGEGMSPLRYRRRTRGW
jgi:LacI family transcriptional regulator